MDVLRPPLPGYIPTWKTCKLFTAALFGYLLTTRQEHKDTRRGSTAPPDTKWQRCADRDNVITQHYRWRYFYLEPACTNLKIHNIGHW